MSVIRARALTKICPQGHVGVCGLDRAVEPGAVLGSWAPTGRARPHPALPEGLIRPTSGGAEIFGRDPQRDAGIRREIG